MPEPPPYRVFLARAARQDFERMAPDLRERIRAAMLALKNDPRGQSEKLAATDAYRKRVGDYRIVFRVDDAAREVLVTRVKHRRDVYRR